MIKDVGNYWGLVEEEWIVMAITYMFEVGCIVEVSNVDARSRRGMGSLH